MYLSGGFSLTQPLRHQALFCVVHLTGRKKYYYTFAQYEWRVKLDRIERILCAFECMFRFESRTAVLRCVSL